jgi:uncharacterized protein (DUF433 family)
MNGSNPPASLHDEPAYRSAEAARLLALPWATVKAWCFGQDYIHQDGTPKRFVRLIEPTDPKRKLLSFANLCELHVLAVVRRHHRVPMPGVRASLDYVAEALGTARPLIAQEFLTNGVELFVEHAGKLLNTSRKGQQALRGDFQQALARIGRNDRGTPVRLFPFTRRGPVELTDQPSVIVIDPRMAFGRPALVRAGVTTEVIQDRFCAGDSPREMADDYSVDEADILEAIRFELEPRRAA